MAPTYWNPSCCRSETAGICDTFIANWYEVENTCITTNQTIHPHFDVVDKAITLPHQSCLIWFDSGTDKVFGVLDSPFSKWVNKHLGWIVEVVEHEWTQLKRGVWLPADAEPPTITSDFHVLPRRWVVEQTFAWLGFCRCLSKDYEYLTATSETFIYAAMSHLMLLRLARRQSASSPWEAFHTPSKLDFVQKD